MSRSASYTPRLFEVSARRGRRGLVGGDWARISAVVRSSAYASVDVSAGRLVGRGALSASSGFFFGMAYNVGKTLDARSGDGYVSVLPRRHRGPLRGWSIYNGGVAQL